MRHRRPYCASHDEQIVKLCKGKKPGNHMASIAMLLRRELRWDPNKEDFIGDAEASKLRSRKQRGAYSIG